MTGLDTSKEKVFFYVCQLQMNEMIYVLARERGYDKIHLFMFTDAVQHAVMSTDVSNSVNKHDR